MSRKKQTSVGATAEKLATQAQKPQKNPKSFKEVEAVLLTPEERRNLSRKQIIEWFTKRSYEKLKALRDEIATGTIREQNVLRKEITERTKVELDELNKDLSIEHKEKIAEQFSEKLFEAAYHEDFEKFLQELVKEEREERLFFSYLGSYGGVKWLQYIEKLKNKPPLKSIFAKRPEIENEFDSLVEEGDFQDVTNFLFKKTPEIESIVSKEEVEGLLATFSSVEGDLDDDIFLEGETYKAIPAIGDYLKKGVEWLKQIGGIGHYKFNKKVAKKFNVNLSNLMKISGLTVVELKERDTIFQKYKHILEDLIKKEKTEKKCKKLRNHLRYIDDVNVIVQKVSNVSEKNRDLLIAGFQKHLDEETELPEEDKAEILAKMDLGALSVQSLLPIAFYGVDYDRENESALQHIGKAIMFRRRFMRAYRVMKGSFTAGGSYHSAVARSQFRRAFRGVAGSSSLKKLVSKYPDMKRFAGQGGPLDQFNKRIDGFERQVRNVEKSGKMESNIADVVGEQDKLFRDYYKYSQKMSKMMTKEAQKVVDVGNGLERLLKEKSGKSLYVTLNKEQAHILGLGAKKAKFSVNMVQDAYLKRLTEMYNIQEKAQFHFRGLGNKLQEKVSGTVQNKFGAKLSVEGLDRKMMKRMDRLEDIQLHGRTLHYGKRYFLPAFALSMPLVDLARGKAKFRDIKYDLAETALAFVPVAGTVADFARVVRGRTISGRKLGIRERFMSFAFGALGAVSDVAWLFGGAGAVMRGGLGAARSGKNLAKVARSGKNLMNTKAAVQSAKSMGFFQRGFRKIYNFVSGGRRAKKTFEAAKGKAKVADLLRRKERLIRTSKSSLKDAKELASLNARLTKMFSAHAKYIAKSEGFARTSLAVSKASKYTGIAGLGLGAIWFLTGANPVPSAAKAVKFAGEKAYQGTVKTAELALGSFKAKTPMEELVERYVRDREYEKRFKDILVQLESSDNKDPEKKKKIEELCANYWGVRHIQAWAHKHKDKLDLNRIMELYREKLASGKESVMDAFKGRSSRAGNFDLMAGVAGGSKSIEQV